MIELLIPATMLALLWLVAHGSTVAAVLLLAVTAGAMAYMVRRADVTSVLYPVFWIVQDWIDRRGNRR